MEAYAQRSSPFVVDVFVTSRPEARTPHSFCARLSDEELVERVSQHKECMACLIDRYGHKMRRFVKKLGSMPSDTIDDIIQEVFIKVYAHIDTFDRDLKFSSWIYRIAHNEAINRIIYEKRRKTENIMWGENLELAHAVIDYHDIWKDIQRDDISMHLRDALGKIPKGNKEVLICKYFEDKSYQEIADRIRKPVNTVGTMLIRGKKMLKKELLAMGINCDIAMVHIEKDFNFRS